MAESRLSVILALRDEMSRQLVAAGGRVERFAKQAREASNYMLGAGGAILFGLSMAVKGARENIENDTELIAKAAEALAAKYGIPVSEALTIIQQAINGNMTPWNNLRGAIDDTTSSGESLVEVLPDGTVVIKNLGEEATDTVQPLKDVEEGLRELGIDRTDGITRLTAALASLANSIGLLLLPAINVLAGFLARLVEQFEKLPKPIQTVISFVAIISGALLVLSALALKGVLAWTAIAAAFGMTGTALAALLLPILLVTAAIIAIIVAGYLLQKNWDTIMNFLAEKAAAMGNAVIGVVNSVIGALEGMVNGAINALNSLANAANSVIGRVVKAPTIPNISLPRASTIEAGQLQGAISAAGQFVMGSGLLGGAGIGFGLGAATGGVGSGQVININVGAMMGNEEDAREFARIMSKYQREEDRTRRGNMG